MTWLSSLASVGAAEDFQSSRIEIRYIYIYKQFIAGNG